RGYLKVHKLLAPGTGSGQRPANSIAEFVDNIGRVIAAMSLDEKKNEILPEACELIAISRGKVLHDPSEQFPLFFYDTLTGLCVTGTIMCMQNQGKVTCSSSAMFCG